MTITRKLASELTTDDAVVDEERGNTFPVKGTKDAEDPEMMYVELELPSSAVHTYSFGKKAQVAVKPV